MRRRVLKPRRLLAFAGLLLGCSPIVRVEARFDLPPGAGKLDPTRLHVRGRVTCHSFDLSEPAPKRPEPPPPGLEEPGTDDDEMPFAPRSLEAGVVADAGARDASALSAPSALSAASDVGDAEAGPRKRLGRYQERSVRFARGEDSNLVRTQFRASSCWLALTAFYDTNGDGVVGPGDFVARVPATEVVDRGLCAGNLNTIGPVKLALSLGEAKPPPPQENR